MATTTPNYGWPVPTSTDYVKDGATAIEALGDAIDATVFGLPSGGLTLVSATTIGSAVASVTVNSAFSATYNNYLIVVSGGAGTTSATNIALIFGATTSNYAYAQIQMAYNSSTVTGANSNLASNFPRVGHASGAGIDAIIEVKNPFASDETAVSFRAGGLGTGQPITFGAGMLDNTTSYTAFTLTPSVGTLTGGTIRVYGYQN
jgi:hypothetical protein